MEKAYETKYHILEHDNWWFNARRDMIVRILRKYCNKRLKILDIGCSGGMLMQRLKSEGFRNVHGLDISADAIRLCMKKGIKNVYVMDGSNPRFKQNFFDVIIASDVLEHIKNPDKALNNWKRLLRKDGRVIIFVPAFMFLWSYHDEINHHYHRYTEDELKLLLRNDGFKIMKSSYWNFMLAFPLFAITILQRLFSKNRNKDRLQKTNKIINILLTALLKAENFVIEKIGLPVGVSVMAIAKK